MTQWDLAKVGRHIKWLREAGPKALIEEDNLDVRLHLENATARLKYRREHGAVDRARALWVLGVQRSGTNMAMRALARHGGVRVYNENSGRAFESFELRAPATVRKLISSSGQPVVAFKPLCDSDRVIELLEQVGDDQSRALWVWRGVDARSRSAVAKFEDANLKMMHSLAAGTDDGEWWSRAVTDEVRQTVVDLDVDTLSAHDAAALFWWMRNRLYYDLGLDEREDVLLVRFEDLLQEPETTMKTVCAHVELDFDPRMTADFEAGRGERPKLDIAPGVRALCDELDARLMASP